MTNDYSMIDVIEAERTPSASSGTDHVDLVSELGCTEMRPKRWELSPGDTMSYTSDCKSVSRFAMACPPNPLTRGTGEGIHRQTEQEELYDVLEGPARIRISEERMDVPEETAIRIPPKTPRRVFNDTDHEHRWLIVGAPPVENDGEMLEE